jgi:hypothetical protein
MKETNKETRDLFLINEPGTCRAGHDPRVRSETHQSVTENYSGIGIRITGQMNLFLINA